MRSCVDSSPPRVVHGRHEPPLILEPRRARLNPTVRARSSLLGRLLRVVDLDLDKLRHVRNRGSVRNLRDRRRDLYEVRWLGVEPPTS
jgi:hypothetical protein